MATAATIEELIDYYVNLLIIQYNNKPKAQAMIRLFAQELMASAIYLDVEHAYNLFSTIAGGQWDVPGETWDTPGETWDSAISDVAQGIQLDVIGKYVGVDRFFPGLDLENYFSLVEYSEIGSLPASPPRFGFETYATFGEFNYNGTLIYDEIVTVNNALSDSDFYTLIKLKVIENTSNYSHGQIDQQMFNFFGTTIRPESFGHMVMFYFISAIINPMIEAILSKKLLPKPMGVGLIVVTGITGKMFALTDYSDYESPYGFGFCDYSNYDSLPGQVLTYSQIMQG